MIYHFTKVICNFWIRLYYGKIEVNGLASLPKDMPILLACNHPTGFLEPVIIACMMDRSLHFITRGDLFSNKLLRPLMLATHQIPIFRFKDGYAGLRQNRSSMDAAETALKGGGALIMFVEGKTEDIKMLKPLQKGMGRISKALHEDGFEHRIIPVGINFLDSARFRSRIMLNFGTAINPHTIFEASDDRRKVLVDLNKQIFEKVTQQMFHVTDRAKHSLHDKVLNIAQVLVPDVRSGSAVQKDTKSFGILKKISDAVESSAQVNVWSERLEKLNIAGKALPLLGKYQVGASRVLMLVVLFPLFAVGVFINALPVLGGLAIERTWVQSREFVGPIRFSASMGLALVFYTVLAVWLVVLYGFAGLFILLGVPLARVAVYYIDLYRSGSRKYTLTAAEVEQVRSICE